MVRTIGTERRPFTVYHVSEAGSPDAHDTTTGEWFFQPADESSGEAFSAGYATADAAEEAAHEWVATMIDEEDEIR
jgi:hypothetical protein